MKYIHQLIILIFLITPILTKAQARIKLFNGENLDGWYAYQETGKEEDASKLFQVDNHLIRLHGTNAGYLMSKESFKNFKLIVKFRWNDDTSFTRKNNKKNSGVMYLVPTETPDELWPKGIQFQIKDGATGDFVLLQNVTLTINNTKTVPGKSVVATRFIDTEKSSGKWNTLVITHINGKITQELNGKLVNKGIDASVLEGRILLQYEGYPIDFCKVTIKKL
jgi:hypothetical protein